MISGRGFIVRGRKISQDEVSLGDPEHGGCVEERVPDAMGAEPILGIEVNRFHEGVLGFGWRSGG